MGLLIDHLLAGDVPPRDGIPSVEILRRFIEPERKPILVAAYRAPAGWLRGSSLSAGINVEHFNAVAGLDQYRAVRGLMVIGRRRRGLAGAITGHEPTPV